MFSSTELMHLVFANENDIIYHESLLKLSLNQYLWFELRKQYKAVYFLSAEEESFAVRTFGDPDASPYERETPKGGLKKLFGASTEQEKFGKWMLRQLQAKPNEAAAIVCPLEDFCGVLSGDKWKSVLEDIAREKKRSGIFVLTASPIAERSKDLLMSCPVFDALGETAITDVRGGQLRDLYGTVFRNKPDSCCFLNAFVRSRVQDLLLHVVMEYPDRAGSLGELEAMAKYLSGYLNEPKRQMSEYVLTKDYLPHSLQYRELYEQLLLERVWKRLESQSAMHPVTGHTVMGMNAVPELPVSRDPKCWAGKCLRLQLPDSIRRAELQGEALTDILADIRSEVSAPKNRPENDRIVEAAEGFLMQLASMPGEDPETWKRLLIALRFCVRWVYTAREQKAEGAVQDIIEKLRSNIDTSTMLYQLKKGISEYEQSMTGGTLQVHVLQQKKQYAIAVEKMLKKHTDLVEVSMAELMMPSRTDGVMQQLSALEDEIKRIGENTDKMGDGWIDPVPDDLPQDSPKPDEDYWPDPEAVEQPVPSDVKNVPSGESKKKAWSGPVEDEWPEPDSDSATLAGLYAYIPPTIG